ncbi:glycoside hydrolase family 13 protein [Brevundimonas lenta]|uniref:Glycosidase n=1 Tax=Brevundimonas lenta TaxID=424796 RepID=A0A7W6JET7_9CAUL|nr:glycoside hydrolase family 13 protein [Brevundimonas lenta]MBB4082827.1 glycosidase [Brevundimonas lenta]
MSISVKRGVAAAALLAAVLGGCATGPEQTTGPEPSADLCTAPPFGETPLYLRGAMSGWAAVDEYAMAWDCDAYAVTAELQGAQDFKIADAAWADQSTFAAPRGGEAPDGALRVARADRGGSDNLRVRFDGWSTLRLRPDGDQPVLTVERASPRVEPLSDPRAAELRHDSRDVRYKSPFGAVTDGQDVAFALDAPAAADRVTLVVETRRLEGNQDVLAYSEVDRLPMTRGADGRWSAHRAFDGSGIYGYWFEVELDGRTFVYQNNSAPIYWTRERGANGEGVATDPPADPAAIRRFRLTVHARDFAVPTWSQQAVWYYVFPERFRNGDPSNDRQPGPNTFQNRSAEVHGAWSERPFRPGSGDGSDASGGNDFFGGDLAGIIDKLDYMADLGVTALYMTPIFTAASNHKYDTGDYRNVDPAFGSNADFERLTREAAARGIRVVVDVSFNHTGRDSLYFDRFAKHPGVGALEGGEVRADSPYADWYRLDPTQADPDNRYSGWTGARDLPELNEASPSYRAFVFGAPDSVTRLWLDRGASGWRMDVAPWVPDDFWREWRTAVKARDPDAVTIAETWFDSSKYFLGDTFDGTMNYIFRNAALDIAGGGVVAGDYRNIELMRELYPAASLRASMNLLSTHDTARSLWLLGDHGDDPVKAADARRRYRLAVLMQVAWPGAPTVFYGDEVGVTGGEDPDNRRTYPWADQGGQPDLAMYADIRRLLSLRKEHPILALGDLGTPLHVDAHTVVASRTLDGTVALIAVNNAETERVIEVALPADLSGRAWVDALTGETVRAGATVRLTLPPLFGAVLVSGGG